MKRKRAKLKQLSVAAIDQSQHIQEWLQQFSERDRKTAKMLLGHLKFVSYDEYSTWLRNVVSENFDDQYCAFYAVRKLDHSAGRFWNETGELVERPGDPLGSEDFVYSLIPDMIISEKRLNHPSLDDLKEKNVQNIVLIDDSIGSGERLIGFMNAMLENRTFLSWWMDFPRYSRHMKSACSTGGTDVKQELQPRVQRRGYETNSADPL